MSNQVKANDRIPIKSDKISRVLVFIRSPILAPGAGQLLLVLSIGDSPTRPILSKKLVWPI